MASPLLDPPTIRRLAEQLDLKPTKQLGQNFVHDANTVRRIVSLAGVQDTDVVLEVGPGLGSLTLGLLQAARSVVAVEIDPRLASLLPVTVRERYPEAAERLHVLTADATDVSELPVQPTMLVANLPYNVSVPVILHLLEQFPTWQRGLVMVQLEVAERLAAQPGSKLYGVPSAKLAWYASSRRVGTVPPGVFWPVPNVDSGLVEIQRRKPPEGDRRATFQVIDAAFAQRRKMLRGALAGLVGNATQAAQLIEAAGVDPTVRGEMLEVSQFAAIASVIQGRN